MEFRILGPVEAIRDGTALPLNGPKIRTVLAALLLARGQVVSDDRLSHLLWGWNPPSTMSAQLYTYVSRLRKILGDGIGLIRTAPGYRIELGDARLDLLEYERLDRLGREYLARGEHDRASALFREALRLWQGPALADVTEFLASEETAQCSEARAATLENRIEADLTLGRHHQLTGELTSLVGQFPLRERLLGQLMIALSRCGRQAEALQAYHHSRAVLSDTLGVDPCAELTEIYLAVLHGRLGPEAAPTTARTVPNMLPPDTTVFLGRERELTEVCHLLTTPGDTDAGPSWRPRRVLITGMAGVGKTALAVRTAHACREHFPDGQLYAELRHRDGTPKDPCEVLALLLRALGRPVSDGAGADHDNLDELVHLYRALTAGKRLLLVLDDAAGDLQIGPLLPSSPQAAVLVTGRTPLATLAGEHTTALAPLPDDAALDLLTAIAGPRRTAAEPDAVARIVAYCAGLPLALRIAGARMACRPHNGAAMLARRMTPADTRLREMSFGDLDLARTLGASLRQLDEAARAALPRLAVLGTSPFTVAEAAALTSRTGPAAERLLEALVDAALLETTMATGADAARPGYRWHPLVQLFAASLHIPGPAKPPLDGPDEPEGAAPRTCVPAPLTAHRAAAHRPFPHLPTRLTDYQRSSA
ncbi:BTAD domain-containing putative transcriptional regulator [Streptomyces sp. NPDC001339]|uniref:AfsR/SARP family transcriptional regulator n=1 Tax=Streptomyces sp. NPDC001339 TaxID=3364563 RepID=UPI00367EE20B